ncbi:MAG: heme NO-binding domain-containing protein [Oligoflexia bacterium]|nr:heme NO-binding domain-containing protein [Oligoflexia bacterium]
MKGDIFSIYEKFVAKNFGQSVYEDALTKAEPHFETRGPFVSPEVYPDGDFITLLDKTLEIVKVPVEQAMILFGRFAFARLAATIPHLMGRYHNSVELLRELDSIIHVEVRKLRQGTNPPKFTFVLGESGAVELVYESERRLYALAQGLILGCADYFAEKVEVERHIHEDGRCTFRLHYDK